MHVVINVVSLMTVLLWANCLSCGEYIAIKGLSGAIKINAHELKSLNVVTELLEGFRTFYPDGVMIEIDSKPGETGLVGLFNGNANLSLSNYKLDDIKIKYLHEKYGADKLVIEGVVVKNGIITTASYLKTDAVVIEFIKFLRSTEGIKILRNREYEMVDSVAGK